MEAGYLIECRPYIKETPDSDEHDSESFDEDPTNADSCCEECGERDDYSVEGATVSQMRDGTKQGLNSDTTWAQSIHKEDLILT